MKSRNTSNTVVISNTQSTFYLAELRRMKIYNIDVYKQTN